MYVSRLAGYTVRADDDLWSIRPGVLISNLPDRSGPFLVNQVIFHIGTKRMIG